MCESTHVNGHDSSSLGVVQHGAATETAHLLTRAESMVRRARATVRRGRVHSLLAGLSTKEFKTNGDEEKSSESGREGSGESGQKSTTPSSRLSNMSVAVDLPAIDLFKIRAGDVGRSSSVAQVNVTLTEDMQVVFVSDMCRTLLDSCDKGMSFAKWLPQREPVLDFLRQIEGAILEGELSLPYVDSFGSIKLCSSNSTLKYRANLDVCFPASWSSQDTTVGLMFTPTSISPNNTVKSLACRKKRMMLSKNAIQQAKDIVTSSGCVEKHPRLVDDTNGSRLDLITAVENVPMYTKMSL